ncbi:aminopeptidase P N-terminal domain-containing protein [Flavobacteriales bacterium AH-315-E23]|nr:aminopeptidase P N-terminal domain-containing protein [Flavobacteriales bacterium AH-315-E23]
MDSLDTTLQLTENLYDTDLLPASFHQSRRIALRSLLPENSVAVFLANSIKNRSNDVDFEFHQNPNFYYLSGYIEPHGILFIFKEDQDNGRERFNELIFVQPRDSATELWAGKRLGVEGIQTQLKFQRAYTNDQFAAYELDLSVFDQVFIIPDDQEMSDDSRDRGDRYSLKKHLAIKMDSTGLNINTILLKEMMSSLREVKVAEELVLLRKAIDITCLAHERLMREIKVGQAEYEAEALIEYVFKSEGAEYPGFPSIVGAGENSCVLHYTSNRKKMVDNDLIVVDIGAEYHGYSADITRTIPVNGKFTKEQMIIYNIVLEAQQAGIAACQPGNRFWAPNDAAKSVIMRRLYQLKLIESRMDYRNYFMHGTSHYLGLDVHDVGLNGNLSEGNVLTVEPGIYIPEGSPCDPKWWNIGVRIEDDILITKTGYEVLSDCVPKSISEIEKLMAGEE